MEESRTIDFINEMIDKEVNIILKDGTTYQGKLKAFDIHTNIVLENCEELKQGKRKKLNEVFISGGRLESCWLVEKK